MNNTTYEFIDESVRYSTLFEFITYGVLLNLIGLFGIIGNILSMIILSRPQMRSSINYLLIGLARCDTILIITSILLFGLKTIHYYDQEYLYTYTWKVFPHISRFVYPLATTMQTLSVYLTLTVTLERFVAVCHPLHARSLCTYGRARLYCILILVFSALYNIPKWFEMKVLAGYDEHNSTIYDIEASDFRNNPIYIKVYIHWLYLIFIYVLPFGCLAVLNAAIYKQVRLANKERARLSRLQKKEIGLATMLLCVVVVFFLCNILALVTNVLESFYCPGKEEDLAFPCLYYDTLVILSNLFVTINSSINFIIYVIFGEKFKRLFLKLFCAPVFHLIGASGRESPDATHDDSVVSNGDNRNYSVRSQSYHLQRAGTAIVRNSNGVKENGNLHRSVRIVRAPSFGPCVYYPSRTTTTTTGAATDWDNSQTTFNNQL